MSIPHFYNFSQNIPYDGFFQYPPIVKNAESEKKNVRFKEEIRVGVYPEGEPIVSKKITLADGESKPGKEIDHFFKENYAFDTSKPSYETYEPIMSRNVGDINEVRRYYEDKEYLINKAKNPHRNEPVLGKRNALQEAIKRRDSLFLKNKHIFKHKYDKKFEKEVERHIHLWDNLIEELKSVSKTNQ